MRTTFTPWRAEQIRDVNRVSALWRDLGHTPRSVRAYRQWTIQLLTKARTPDYRELSAVRTVKLAYSFARQHHHGSPEQTRRRWLSAFRAFAWGLRRLKAPVGAIDLPKRSRCNDPLMQAFAEYGRKLGWCEQTLLINQSGVNRLRSFLLRRRAPWPVPQLRDLDRFLHWTSKRWTKSFVATQAGACRAWLRFLFITSRADHDLAESVALPPSIVHPRPARAVPWPVIRRLGKGIDRSNPIGLRDYAQYLLFCGYGLSNAEAINLKLEDVDWDAAVLHIRRVKNSATVDLPLLASVAKALARYVRRGRPSSPSRNVFLRHTIPFGPLSHATVGQRVRCWAKRAGVQSSYLGVHLFRHSFATRQLERGTPLKVIGDILGHRHCQTTAIYVRTALARLRPLALPVPK